MTAQAEPRVPKRGETYYDGRVKRRIRSVDESYVDGGFMVTCDNRVGYDCYWQDGLGWQYWPPGEQEAWVRKFHAEDR